MPKHCLATTDIKSELLALIGNDFRFIIIIEFLNDFMKKKKYLP